MNITVAALLFVLPLAQGDTDYVVQGRTGSQNTCGPDSLYVVLRIFGYLPDLVDLREGINDYGTDLSSLKRLAEEYGLDAVPIQADFGIPEIAPPFILHSQTGQDGHFIALLAKSDGDDGKWLVYDNNEGMAWLAPEALSRKYQPSGAALSFNPAELQQTLAKSTAFGMSRKVIISLCVFVLAAYVLITSVRAFGSLRKRKSA